MIAMIRRYPELLIFGLLTAVFSGPGQTFLVSLFIPSMRDSLGLTPQAISSIYALATLASGFLLPWTGRLFDRASLLVFTLAAALLLAAGCALLGFAHGIILIFLGFFLVRNLGQGTLTLISSTCMAKLFGEKQRGKALGIANLGYPLGEMVFPGLILFWISVYGWRSGWFFLAALIVCFFLPVTFFLLRHDPHKKAQDEIAQAAETANPLHPKGAADWEVRDILKDPRFYFILFPCMIPPAFFTALFFHQLDLFAVKGWDSALIATGFAVFGLMRGVLSFLCGPLIDRVSARRLFPFNLFPLGAGLCCFIFGQQDYWSLLYLALSGMTMGISGTVSSALYAELYGVRRLGSLRGMTTSIMIFVTAGAPVVLSFFLAAHSLSSVLTGMLVILLLACASAVKGTVGFKTKSF